ncbi:hypothetical protein F5Y17DRAFT_457272 [Xylariaceae sp. FL0594]|nr:hypothetical protein F5Y17DRAFT_457272 [Xylariaceae sp. FL0594]
MPTYKEMLSYLDNDTVYHILEQLVTVSPSAQAAVSKKAWHALHVRYSGLSGGWQCDAAGDVAGEILSYAESIGDGTCEDSSYRTKLSALRTLRKMAKSIIMADSTLAHEVRQEFCYRTELAESMLHIVKCMTFEERCCACQTVEREGFLVDKIAWICDEAEDGGYEGLNLSESWGTSDRRGGRGRFRAGI